MAILEKETQSDSRRYPDRRQIIVAVIRLPVVDEEVEHLSFIACGGCPHPEVCYFKGGCEQGNPTG
jgi:hypothetical protein